MKKFLFTFFIMVSLSMSANSLTKTQDYISCEEYAANAADAEEDAYGEMCAYDWINAALDYYDMCEDAGGADAMLEPVFL